MARRATPAGPSARATAAACPCGSGAAYSRCCRPYHLVVAEAPTAEALMRSRYSAYVKLLASYLVRTWHPDTRPEGVSLDGTPQWQGLTVVSVTAGGPDDERGTVTFVARHHRGELRETSEFVRLGDDEGRRWVYVGEAPA